MIRLTTLLPNFLHEDDDGLGPPPTGPTCAWCGAPVSSSGRMGKSNLNLCAKCKVKYYLGDGKIPTDVCRRCAGSGDEPGTSGERTCSQCKGSGTASGKWGDDDAESLDVKTEAKERNYKKEYEEYQGKPEQIKRRAGRNAARRKLKKLGRVRKGQDVDHKDRNPKNNAASNLRAQSVSANRSRNK